MLITGAGGFIGGRLAEVACIGGRWAVRAMVRRPQSAARIARLPVEIVVGDVTRRQTLHDAVSGCDAVVHCAYGGAGSAADRRRVDVDGTWNLLTEAALGGVRRFVYVSTVMVYEPTEGPLTETSPRYRGGDPYASSKLETETMVALRGRELGIETVIVQPTVVYGPYGPFWTIRPLAQMKTGTVVLVDGGDGTCNAAYVDDIVDCLCLATEHPEAAGEVFLASGPQAETWKTFIGSYEGMLGRKATLAVTAKAARRSYSRRQRALPLFTMVRLWRNDAEFREKLRADPAIRTAYSLAYALVPESLRARLRSRLVAPDRPTTGPRESATGPIHWPSPAEIEFITRRTVVDTSKAARLLGFTPRFPLSRGMSLTGHWARWQGLL
jgi:nucleoside-diphosphate-sugar epimerase